MTTILSVLEDHDEFSYFKILNLNTAKRKNLNNFKYLQIKDDLSYSQFLYNNLQFEHRPLLPLSSGQSTLYESSSRIETPKRKMKKKKMKFRISYHEELYSEQGGESFGLMNGRDSWEENRF